MGAVVCGTISSHLHRSSSSKKMPVSDIFIRFLTGVQWYTLLSNIVGMSPWWSMWYWGVLSHSTEWSVQYLTLNPTSLWLCVLSAFFSAKCFPSHACMWCSLLPYSTFYSFSCVTHCNLNPCLKNLCGFTLVCRFWGQVGSWENCLKAASHCPLAY